MKTSIFPILTFILITVGAVAYIYFNSIIPVDPYRVTLNKEGKEEIVLNDMEKEFLGNWYFSFVGLTPLNMIPKKKYEKEYWSLNEKGMAIYYKPTGKKQHTIYWQISPEDSMLRLINFREQDTVKYKIYRIGEDFFTTYKYPNALHNKGARFITWKRHDGIK